MLVSITFFLQQNKVLPLRQMMLLYDRMGMKNHLVLQLKAE